MEKETAVVFDNPLAVIDLVHENALEIFGHETGLQSADSLIDSMFSCVMRVHQHSVPELSSAQVESLVPNKLMRYRGMIRDSYNVEFFCGMYDKEDGTKVVCKYRDSIPAGCEDDPIDGTTTILERQNFLLSPLPETTWCKETSKKALIQHVKDAPLQYTTVARAAVKRGHDNTEDDTHIPVTNNFPPSELSVQGELTCSYKLHRGEVQKISSSVSQGCNLIQPGDGFCLAKVYNGMHGNLRLNDIIEVVGIYTVDALSFPDGVSNDDLLGFNQWDTEDASDLPPASLAPRLHCLHVVKLCSSFPMVKEVSVKPFNQIDKIASDLLEVLASTPVPRFTDGQFDAALKGLIAQSLADVASVTSGTASIVGSDVMTSEPAPIMSVEGEGGVGDDHDDDDDVDAAAALREVIHEISGALGGDEVAAEYIALALLSRLYARNNTNGHENDDDCHEVLVGRLVVNVFGFACDDNRVQKLSVAIANIVPRLVTVKCDVPALNSSCCLLPERQEASLVISPSPLQAPAGTVLVLDETGTTTGVLSDTAVKSVRALRSVVLTQRLPINFSYCPISVPTDLPTVVLSTVPTVLFSGCEDLVRICLSPAAVPSLSSDAGGDDGDGDGNGDGDGDAVADGEGVDSMALGGVAVVDGAGLDKMAVGGGGGGGGVEGGDDEGVGKLDDGNFVVVMDGLVAGPISGPETSGDDHRLSRMRMWWARMRLRDITMGPDMVAVAEEEFVSARQAADCDRTREAARPQLHQGQQPVSIGEFHTWLTVSRLVVLSRGDIRMVPSHWQHMRALEYDRNLALNSPYA